MPEYVPLEIPENPKLAGNITHFARALRRAGLPIGPGRVIDAIRAVEAAGFTEKQDFYWTLQACFVRKPEERRVFGQVFRLYWRDPRYLEHMMSYMIPAVRGVAEERKTEAAEKRAAQALLDGMGDAPDEFDAPEEDGTEIEIDASLTISQEEKLKTLDFEQMSTDEMAQAKRMLARLTLPVEPLASRRMQRSGLRAVVDPAATLRRSMRQGGELRDVAWKTQRERWPNLVVLCDISGSMSQYSRVVLHFLHAVANAKGQGWAKVHAFTFGTRLTNITRHLRNRDVDEALARAGQEAEDWEGGTRIGACLEDFNKTWSRRVLGQGAVVLMITDGLDRDDPGALSKQAERLHLSSRRLIWLNPLLRWDGFEARAQGVRALLPHVDTFTAAHSIGSLEELARIISDAGDRGDLDRLLKTIPDH